MGRSEVANLPRDGAQDEDHCDTDERTDKLAIAIERDGFNVHAGVRIEAGDDLGRERLARYGARPPLSLERLAVVDAARADRAGERRPDERRPRTPTNAARRRESPRTERHRREALGSAARWPAPSRSFFGEACELPVA